jgi:hypothetical protein
MDSGQALRMTSPFAMVSSHREPDERRTIPLTLALSPQGRGKSRKVSLQALHLDLFDQPEERSRKPQGKENPPL